LQTSIAVNLWCLDFYRRDKESHQNHSTFLDDFANGKLHDTNGRIDKKTTSWRVVKDPLPK